MNRGSAVGVASVAALLLATAYGASVGIWKLVGIAWVAFVAMAGLGLLGARSKGRNPGVLVWGYGLASGAMITSAAVFLLPSAVGHHPAYGGFGVALGILVGFGGHTVGHRLSHLDVGFEGTIAQLTAHAATGGAIMGLVYGNMPQLGPLLGLAIVSHKGPAGYAAASRLAQRDESTVPILLPSAAVGVVAIVASAIDIPATPAVMGVVFGFATGVFLHIAMDFLPRCELGSEIHEALSVEGDAHALLDRLRIHAVVSTGVGAVVVFLAWNLFAG